MSGALAAGASAAAFAKRAAEVEEKARACSRGDYAVRWHFDHEGVQQALTPAVNADRVEGNIAYQSFQECQKSEK
jgi:hypothetical protein